MSLFMSLTSTAAFAASRLPCADRIELTEVAVSPDGDTVLEAFDTEIWKEISRVKNPAEGSTPAFDFVTLVRREA